MPTLPPLLDRLANLDTCAVSDAMDTLGFSGSVVSPQQLTGNKRLCGIVTTVHLEKGPAPPAAEKVHLCARAIDASGPGHVIVVEHPGIEAGGWGGVLSTAAKLKGINGVILNGPSRDIDEARELGFPVFATRGIVRTARARLHESTTNTPITIDGVSVSPGDYVIADASGVVFIAAAQIEQALDKAGSIALRERAMVEALKSGNSVVEVLGADYEDMLKR